VSSAKILIIDDDPDLTLGLAIRLQSNGYEVASASDATMALTRVLQEQPGLIILDLALPGGDGFTVLERLRKNTKTALIPVIVLTAKGQDLQDKALQQGAAAFFQKPADNEALLQAIARCLPGSMPTT
jgi:two-component system response regulator RpaA